MEEIQARHRKEIKELQNKITAKKKQASKKTRKGVNDECDRLEQALKEQHAEEIASLNSTESNVISTNKDVEASHDELPESVSDTTTPINPPDNVEIEPELKRKGPNKAKARLARRAAALETLQHEAEQESHSMTDNKSIERENMLNNFKSRGLVEKEIRADGHCLYSAIADQLSFLSLDNTNNHDGEKKVDYRDIRRRTADYISFNKDDFLPFISSDVDDDGGGIEGYTRKIRDTAEWGGQVELMAISRFLNTGINVLQGNGRVEEIRPLYNIVENQENETRKDDEKVLWLAYYRHGFGLGEHYNSLHKSST